MIKLIPGKETVCSKAYSIEKYFHDQMGLRKNETKFKWIFNMLE